MAASGVGAGKCSVSYGGGFIQGLITHKDNCPNQMANDACGTFGFPAACAPVATCCYSDIEPPKLNMQCE